jgi:YD repeat-containing protein
MPPKIRYGFLIGLVVISLVVISFNTSYGETVNYFYDDLHRLIRVEYGSGVAIEYTYDQYGNRTQEIIHQSVPPTTTASPPGGTYYTAQTVILTCDDGTGSGCDRIYYTTNRNNRGSRLNFLQG